ncbi:F-box protein SKIP23-like [Fagus crenata]
MHLLDPLTSSKLKAVFQTVLDSSKFRVYEFSKEYVLQFTPKNQAGCELSEYDFQTNLAVHKVSFLSLSPDSEDFLLLLEGYLGGLVQFKSADMQWTKCNVQFNNEYDVIPFSGRFITFSESKEIFTISRGSRYYWREKFLIDLQGQALSLVKICYIRGQLLRSVRQIDCSKPDGEMVSFQIYVKVGGDQQNWENVDSIGI